MSKEEIIVAICGLLLLIAIGLAAYVECNSSFPFL